MELYGIADGDGEGSICRGCGEGGKEVMGEKQETADKGMDYDCQRTKDETAKKQGGKTKMRDGNEGLESRCGDGAAGGKNGEGGKRKSQIIRLILLVIILILILLCLRSCRAGDEPVPEDAGRAYEEDHGRDDGGSYIPAAEGGRLNLAVSECYRITDGRPYFYIGFPEENAYDVVFTLKDSSGNSLYRTDYVSPGTNVAIDGTAFLTKGEQKVDCLVSIYDRDSGVLVSDCTTVVLNVSYQ